MADVADRSAASLRSAGSAAAASRVARPPELIRSIERNRRWLIGGLLLVDLVLLLAMGRGLTFYYDEWEWFTLDYGGGLHRLLVAHVGNISIFPVAVYKILFHLVGLNHYAVFRLVVVALHLTAAWLIYILVSRRLSPIPALIAMTLILFLGAAWEDLLWPFQIGYMLSIVGGLSAWALLERGNGRGDLLATVALVIATGSSSLGVPLVVGVAIELAWRRDLRRAWIALVPAALYALWYIGYGQSQVTEASLIASPGYAADLAAAASGAIVGHGLGWGRPLALLGLVVLVRSLLSRPISPRLAGLIATGLTLWAITAVTRSTISPPESSRYVYLGAVVIVLVAVELFRGYTVSPRTLGLSAAGALLALLAGLTLMHNGATNLRSISNKVKAELGALELAAAYAPPHYRPDPTWAPQVEARSYLRIVHSIGSSPADDPTQIAASNPSSRAAADGVLISLDVPRLTPLSGASQSPLAHAPVVVRVGSGAVVAGSRCVALAPQAGVAMSALLTLPAGGVSLSDRGPARASLALKRFGAAFVPIAGVASGRVAALTIAADASPTAWQLQTRSTSELRVCGLGR